MIKFTTNTDFGFFYPEQVNHKECKTESELIRKVDENPDLFNRCSQGIWINKDVEVTYVQYDREFFITVGDFEFSQSMLCFEYNQFKPNKYTGLDFDDLVDLINKEWN